MSVPPHQQRSLDAARTLHDLPADEVISALQKEIRRGHTENAAMLAYEMLSTSPELEEYLWGRLQVISVEDIGLGNVSAPVLIETLYQLHLRIARPRGDRYLYAIHAVRGLSGSQKERGSDFLLDWLMQAVDRDGRHPRLCARHAHAPGPGDGPRLRPFPHRGVEGQPGTARP